MLLANFIPPPTFHILSTLYPALNPDQTSRLLFPAPPVPDRKSTPTSHGNSALGTLSAASSPIPTRLSTPAVDYPQVFTAEQLAAARSSHPLQFRDFRDCSKDTLSVLIPSQTATLTLLSQLVTGVVTISQDLSAVNQKLASLAEENNVREDRLHDLSSQIAFLLLAQTPRPHLTSLSFN